MSTLLCNSLVGVDIARESYEAALNDLAVVRKTLGVERTQFVAPHLVQLFQDLLTRLAGDNSQDGASQRVSRAGCPLSRLEPSLRYELGAWRSCFIVKT